MKTSSTFIAIAMSCLLLAACDRLSPFGNPSSAAAAEPAPSPSAQDAATEGLKTLRGLVNAGNYKGLGFSSAEDAARATLGEPLPIQRIGLEALRGYNAEKKADSLLEDAQRSLYPVEVDHAVASSISVTQRDGGWRATTFGDAALAQLATRYRQSKDDFLLQVPALKVYFTARNSADGLLLTSLIDDPRYDLKAGETRSLTQIVQILQRSAEGYNGLPQ